MFIFNTMNKFSEFLQFQKFIRIVNFRIGEDKLFAKYSSVHFEFIAIDQDFR